jgi:hypothetical protein
MDLEDLPRVLSRSLGLPVRPRRRWPVVLGLVVGWLFIIFLWYEVLQ